nr:MAG TPA: hypothetical protein [Caudoviricetes sp.]
MNKYMAKIHRRRGAIPFLFSQSLKYALNSR